MEKHHIYVLLGVALAIFGGGLAPLVPFLEGLHGAGLGVAIAGLIDWMHAYKGA